MLIAVQESADMFIVLGFLLPGLWCLAMIYFAENDKQTNQRVKRSTKTNLSPFRAHFGGAWSPS